MDYLDMEEQKKKAHEVLKKTEAFSIKQKSINTKVKEKIEKDFKTNQSKITQDKQVISKNEKVKQDNYNKQQFARIQAFKQKHNIPKENNIVGQSKEGHIRFVTHESPKDKQLNNKLDKVEKKEELKNGIKQKR